MDQERLFTLETDKESRCPGCGAGVLPLFPMELYTCGNCGRAWIPAAEAEREPLFNIKERSRNDGSNDD